MTPDEIDAFIRSQPQRELPPLPRIKGIEMSQGTAWGWTDPRVMRGSRDQPPVNAFGPPHPSWCPLLWHARHPWSRV